MSKSEPQLISVKTAAELLHCSIGQFTHPERTERLQLRRVDINGKIFFYRSEVLLIKQNRESLK